jgi:GWxTD domain-containing protein
MKDMGISGRSRILFIVVFMGLFLNGRGGAAQEPDPWKAWLEEVRPIMTKGEEAAYRSLQTLEDREKFQRLFWKYRDPDPSTPENEFRTEYYNRRSYAEKHLGGVDSDRGRVYLLLGKPFDRYDFSGSENIVDCELWVYQNTGLPGLPPMMDLIFYRENNIGDLKLFFPGSNSPQDILSPSYMRGSVSKMQAYKTISMSFPELGRATLSVVPDEASMELGSMDSGSAISQIFTLPERQYHLTNYRVGEGTVDVTYSTREIAGNAVVALSRDRGFWFLNCAFFPEILHTIKGRDGVDRARIILVFRIVDPKGAPIHQQERSLDLKFDEKQKKLMLEKKKLVFNDFVPIVEGEFTVYLTFMNKTSDEFFIHKESLSVSAGTAPLLAGYKVEDAGSDLFLPFRDGAFKVTVDPRFLFTREDSLAGIVSTGRRPEISLVSRDDPKAMVAITPTDSGPGSWLFRKPLTGIRPGYYTLRVQLDGREVASRDITILSFKIEKPLGLEHSEPAASSLRFDFIVAQEYLNKGDVERAIETFQKLPAAMWDATTLPVIARAYYLKKDYAKTIELLENEAVVKTYPILLMLGNSCLETKNLRQAADYFELVRKYGDTVDSNRVLGAIYYTLGDKKKAHDYWDRAKALEQRDAEKDPDQEKKP